MSLRDSLRNFDRLRRRKMAALEAPLYRLFSNRRALQSELVPAEQVRRILVVRNNRRIGNTVFLLLFVRELKRLYPNASIELMFNRPWQGQIVENYGVERVHYSRFTFGDAKFFPGFVRAMRRESYDMVFVPYPSITDLILAGLPATKNLIALETSRTEQICTHTYPRSKRYRHYALQPLELLEAMGLPPAEDALEPALHFSDAEIDRARQQAASFRDDSNPLLVAFFRGARGEKGIEDDTWHELLGQIADGAHRPVRCIEILSPDIDAPLSAAHANFQTPSFRELAAFLGQLDLFICADTGPLHLAAAGGARCLGLFTQTEPAVYGCLSARSTSLTEFAQLDVPALLNKA